MEYFNQQSPKRGLNKGVGKKNLPKGGCVMDACGSLLVASDKVHTQTYSVS